MSQPVASLLRPQFAVEPSFGGTVAPVRIFVGVENSGFDVSPEQTKEATGIAGVAFQTSERITMEMGKGTVKGVFEYRDFPYFLSGPYGAPTTVWSTSNATTNVYNHVFRDAAYAPIVPQSFYAEWVKGGSDRACSTSKIVFTGLKLDTSRDKQASLNVNAITGVINDGITPGTGQNDVQTLDITSAGGGLYDLYLDNLVIKNIPTNSTAAALQTLIQGLGGIWASATVSRANGSAVPVGYSHYIYTITNTTGTYVPDLIARHIDINGNTTLTETGGNTIAAIVTAHPTVGGMQRHDMQPVLPAHVSVSYASTLDGLVNAPTLVVNEFETSIDIAERFEPVWRQNPSDTSHGDVVQKKASDLKDMIGTTLAYTSEVASFITNSRSGTRMYMQVKFLGPQIDTTGKYFSILYQACVIPTWRAFKDSNGNVHSVEIENTVVYDLSTGFRSQWVVVNDVPGYTS